MAQCDVLHADYHRNGIGGAGFYVALLFDHTTSRRMLLTWFPEYRDPHPETGAERLARRQDYVSVIDVDQAAEGNIYMHPGNGQPGGNAWRGADYYADVLPLIEDAVDDLRNRQLARLMP